jgi:maleylacetoacetate isomerase/maleylpyruvate isomerase
MQPHDGRRILMALDGAARYSAAMKLYNYFRSSASFRVRIALHLKELPFDYLAVHLARGEHLDPAFAGKVADPLLPVLQTDEGGQLVQSMAIIEYLDELHPAPPLLPPDAWSRAQVRALAQSVACDIHPINNLRVLRYLTKTLRVDDDAKNAWYRHWTRQGLVAFERQLERLAAADAPEGAFCWGDAPTLADCCLVPQVFNAKRFDVDLSGLTRTLRAFDACMALDAFGKAQPSNCPDAEA